MHVEQLIDRNDGKTDDSYRTDMSLKPQVSMPY